MEQFNFGSGLGEAASEDNTTRAHVDWVARSMDMNKAHFAEELYFLHRQWKELLELLRM